MTAPTGLLGAISTGWHFVTNGISRTYEAAWVYAGKAGTKALEIGIVRKTVDFVSPFFDAVKRNYPDALKFTWSKGTALTTTLLVIGIGAIFRRIQSEESRNNNRIADLEAIKAADRKSYQIVMLKAHKNYQRDLKIAAAN